MSLTVDGIWKAGVWATTVWAYGVWSEPTIVVFERKADGEYPASHKKKRRISVRENIESVIRQRAESAQANPTQPETESRSDNTVQRVNSQEGLFSYMPALIQAFEGKTESVGTDDDEEAVALLLLS